MARTLDRRGVLGAGATLVACLALRNSPATAQEAKAPDAISAVTPPGVLPALAFTTLDGASVKLSAYLGKPVVLNFWATWCIPCVAELPELDKLAADPAFTVLAASADHGGAAAVKPFLARRPLSHLTVLLDPGTTSGHALDVFSFPYTFIIDAAGRLRGQLDGPARWAEAGGRIRALTA